MRLVKALMGGVIGGVISIAIMVGAGIYYFFGVPSWMALMAGVVTGLSVRIMGKSDKPGPCYVCGAIAALLTLAAVYGGTEATSRFVQSSVESKQEGAESKPIPPEKPASPAESEPTDDESAADSSAATNEETSTDEPPAVDPSDEATVNERGEEAEVVEEVVEVAEPAAVTPPAPLVKREPTQRAKEDFSISLFVFIVLGALVAYELGRSCGCSKAA